MDKVVDMADSSFGELKKSWGILFSDPWIFSLVTWVPLVFYFGLYTIFSGGLVRELPIGVVDYDHSALSRTFTQYYDSPSALAVESYSTEKKGFDDLRAGKIYGLVIIPENLQRDAQKGLAPQVSAFINYQYLLIGKQVNSNLQNAHRELNASLSVSKELSDPAKNIERAAASVVPFAIQITALGNTSSNYSQFLVTAVVPAAWQIFCVVLSILSLIRLQETGRMVSVSYTQILAQLSPMVLIFFLQGACFYALMFNTHWPMQGSWAILLFALLLATLACTCAGTLFYTLTLDGPRALSLGAAYTAPGFAFMGITYPVLDMNIVAQLWRNLLPLSHLSEIQILQTNLQSGLAQNLPFFGFLCLLLLINGSVSALLWRKKGASI